jgi:hypothetical protein
MKGIVPSFDLLIIGLLLFTEQQFAFAAACPTSQ